MILILKKAEKEVTSESDEVAEMFTLVKQKEYLDTSASCKD